MPSVEKNETKEHYLARCIPMLIKEGKKQDQAEAQCINMFKEKWQAKSSVEITKDKYGVETLELEVLDALAFVSHDSPPKGYPNEKTEYADPANYKYPINNKERVLAAWRYINKSHNQSGYSSSELAAIKSRIKSAGKKFGLDLKDGE